MKKPHYLLIALFTLLGCLGASAAQARLLGTLLIGYGPAGQPETTYYGYEVWDNNANVVESEVLLAKLKRGTSALPYKSHSFYLGQNMAGAQSALLATLPKKEQKRSTFTEGGGVDAQGNNRFELLSPQQPRHGIQVSSADMSAFTNNQSLGTMMLYYGSGSTISSAYLYELRGRELTDKAALAAELAKRVSGSLPFIGFEMSLGKCADAQAFIQRKSGTSVSTHCQGEYKVN